MHRRSIAGEGVERQYVEMLRALSFHREPRVAHFNLIVAAQLFQIPQVSEVRRVLGDRLHLRIDFVEGDVCARLGSVGAQTAATESDDDDSQPWLVLEKRHRLADAGAWAGIRSPLHPL